MQRGALVQLSAIDSYTLVPVWRLDSTNIMHARFLNPGTLGIVIDDVRTRTDLAVHIVDINHTRYQINERFLRLISA